MKNAILFGNGFNRLSSNLSWDKLLNRISKDSLISDIPNTLQYETIILANEFYQYEQLFDANGDRLITSDGQELYVRDKPVEEEIKWSDLWEIHKGKYRSEFLKSKTEDGLKGYYRRVFNRAASKNSLEFIFTVTCVYTQPCYHSEEELLKFHLQEAMQHLKVL